MNKNKHILSNKQLKFLKKLLTYTYNARMTVLNNMIVRIQRKGWYNNIEQDALQELRLDYIDVVLLK